LLVFIQHKIHARGVKPTVCRLDKFIPAECRQAMVPKPAIVCSHHVKIMLENLVVTLSHGVPVGHLPGCLTYPIGKGGKAFPKLLPECTLVLWGIHCSNAQSVDGPISCTQHAPEIIVIIYSG